MGSIEILVEKMRCITSLLILGTLTSAIPVEKDKKSFSLFSVLSFPNNECETTLTNNPVTSGVCLTASECTDAGGTAEGNCASSFGVCCFVSVSATDTLIGHNITYIQNEAYPSTYGGNAAALADPTREWVFNLEGKSEICQIRLDFEDVVLHQPTTGGSNGKCGGATGDSITVTTSTATMVGFNTLCGTLTGQHVYIHNSVDTAVTTVDHAAVITINIGSEPNFERRWKIKTSRIECGNPNEADEGCLQWFTGAGGQVKSFNYQDTAQMLISNLLYSVCIRKEEGMCGMVVSQSRNTATPDAFALQDATGAVTGDAQVDASCDREFVGIASSKVTTSKYCGGLFAPAEGDTSAGAVPSDSLPLRITVVTDNANARAANSGFDLKYSQTPCSP